jgi:hypothetical protein
VNGKPELQNTQTVGYLSINPSQQNPVTNPSQQNPATGG